MTASRLSARITQWYNVHPWAMHAADDANCLAAQNNQAYWDFADTIHARQSEVNGEKTSSDRLDAIDRLTSSQAENTI